MAGISIASLAAASPVLLVSSPFWFDVNTSNTSAQQPAACVVMARLTVTQAVPMGFELLLSILAFVLFCSAYPDQYRTRLWSIGGERGWNSNPHLRIYFYANYEDPPEIPLIWSQR